MNNLRLANVSYSRSFTVGALMLAESALIIELYLDKKDWDQVKKEAVAHNILHARTNSSLIRTIGEAVTRVRNLSDDQLTLFIKSDKVTQKQLLWFAICKTFPFIYDFAKEVLNDKYVKMEPIISLEDINVFFIKKAGWHDELEAMSESTKNKMKQVLLRMLIEADLVDTGNRIIPVFFSSEFLSCMPGDRDWRCIYPAHIPIMETAK